MTFAIGDHSGLTGKTISYARVGTPTTVAGTSKLYTSSIGPEGLLLKDITSLEEAVACGGLLLVSATDDWIFYAGDILKQVIARNQLGLVAVGLGIGTSLATFSGLAYRLYEEKRDVNGAPTIWLNRGTRYGQVHREVHHEVYFPNGALRLVGIVTSASTGHGAKRNLTRWYRDSFGIRTENTALSPISFMATETELSVPLKTMLSQTKSSYLASIPEEASAVIGPIYTAEAVKRVSKPPVRAVTCWTGRTRVNWAPVPVAISTAKFVATDMSYQALHMGVVNNVTELPGYSAYASNANVVTGSQGSLGSGLTWQWNSDMGDTSAVAVERDTFDASNEPKYVWGAETVFGRYAAGGIIPCISPSPGCAYVTTPAVTGKIGTYTGGALRDGHVLGRFFVEMLSFADAADNYSSMYDYLLAGVAHPSSDWLRFNQLQVGTQLTPGPAQDAEAATLVSGLAPTPMTVKCDFTISDLPGAVDEFLDVVYDLARA